MEKTKEQIERDEQIYQLTTLVAGKFSPQEVLDKLAEAAVKIIGVKACSIRLLDSDTSDLKMRSTYGLSEEYRNKGVVSKNDPVIKAAFEGEAVVLDDMRVDDRVKYKEATVKEGLVSQLTVAMQFQGRAIGVLRLYSPETMRFDKDDIRLARAVASQCAVAITNAKLYSKAIEGAKMTEQMRLAGFIQRKMIPERAPKIPGLDIAATYIPCFDVGGDFYDFQKIGRNRLAVAIADVMGKGMPAALMMSCFRSAVRAYSDIEDEALNIPEFIKKLNRMMCVECTNGEFVTFFYAVIDAYEKTIIYCNCGHEPAVLLRREYAIDLNKGGMVLGVDQNCEYEVDALTLETDDCLLFYTDGLIDAANFDGDMWGKTNLIKTTKQFCTLSAELMNKNILSYRRRFVGLADQVDDTSFIILKMGEA
jgi:sigma-B regulation protein RsbU (phosphoserine phosphatase)